ncbi:MAG: ribonuclease P protein component [Bythopirellula sp.]
MTATRWGRTKLPSHESAVVDGLTAIAIVMMRSDFPKSVRLLKSAEFDRVFRRRCSCSDGLLILYAAESESERPRLGLVVSKKCGNAVARNRWKRSLREAFRLVQHQLPRNIDLVVMPQRHAKPEVARLQNTFEQLANRAYKRLIQSAEVRE